MIFLTFLDVAANIGIHASTKTDYSTIAGVDIKSSATSGQIELCWKYSSVRI